MHPLLQEGRKGETGIDVLCKYFHLPIKEASDVLGICPTSLKKICRTHGLQRWPHRRASAVMHVVWMYSCTHVLHSTHAQHSMALRCTPRCRLEAAPCSTALHTVPLSMAYSCLMVPLCLRHHHAAHRLLCFLAPLAQRQGPSARAVGLCVSLTPQKGPLGL
ncbi:RWP-RK domain-containing protein [Haematococcus lacustris]